MTANAYSLISMAMRYWFCFLIVVVVWLGWRSTLRDSREARKTRNRTAGLNAIGEAVVIDKARKSASGKAVPIPREGILGSSRRADVCIRSSELHRYHAYFEQRGDALLLKALRNNDEMQIGRNHGNQILIRNRGIVSFGSLNVLFILKTETNHSKGASARKNRGKQTSLFETEEDGKGNTCF